MHRRFIILAIAMACASPVTAAAQPVGLLGVVDGAGHLWDLDLISYDLRHGTFDTWGGMGRFETDDWDGWYNFYDDGYPASYDPDLGVVTSSGSSMGSFWDALHVYQVWYLPSDESYARQSIFLRNPENQDAEFDVTVKGFVGYDDHTLITATSSGDTDVDPTDVWLTASDGGWNWFSTEAGILWGDGTMPLSNDPNLGEDSGNGPSPVLVLSRNDVTFQPGILVGLHVFYFQGFNTTELATHMASILDDPVKAFTTGLTEEEILSTGNFDLSDMDFDGYDNAWFGGDDCNDSDPADNVDGTESCDGLDNDCDGDVDEGLTSTYYLDVDGDGYGDEATAEEACEAPEGDWVSDGGDCDDRDQSEFPGADEVCDGEDNDCDGDVDEDGVCGDDDGDDDGADDDDGDDDDGDDDDGGGACQCAVSRGPVPWTGGLALALMLGAMALRRRG